MFALFTFNSTHQAILMEKVFEDAGINLKLIPVPRSISASCGLAARIDKDDFSEAIKIISENEIEIGGAYSMDNGCIKKMQPDGQYS